MKKLLISLFIIVVALIIFFYFKRLSEDKTPSIPGKIIPTESLQDTSNIGI